MIDAAAFRAARPFPHLVADDLWDPALLQAAVDAFPDPTWPGWQTFGGDLERGKQQCSRPDLWPAPVATAMRILTRLWPPIVSHYLGVDVEPAVIGGGMHQSPPGARLGMHVDFNRHAGRLRVANLPVFLNDGWTAEQGGALYLGRDRDVEVLPTFGRTVLFATSDTSWHGHPDPVLHGIRRSLACYYYARVDALPPEHSTIFADEGGAP